MDGQLSVLFLVRQILSIFNSKCTRTILILSQTSLSKEQLMAQSLSQFAMPPLGASPLEKPLLKLFNSQRMLCLTTAEAEHVFNSPHSGKLMKVLDLLKEYMHDSKKRSYPNITSNFASTFLEINREIFNYLSEEVKLPTPCACYSSESVKFFTFTLDIADLVLNSLLNLHAALGHVIALVHCSLIRSLELFDKKAAQESFKGKQSLLSRVTAQLNIQASLQVVENLSDSKILQFAQQIEQTHRLLKINEISGQDQVLALMVLSFPKYFANKPNVVEFAEKNACFLWESLGKDWDSTLSLPNFKNLALIKLLMNNRAFHETRKHANLQRSSLFELKTTEKSVFTVLVRIGRMVWLKLETLIMFQIKIGEREKSQKKWSIQEDLKQILGNLNLLRKIIRHASLWDEDQALEMKRSQLIRQLSIGEGEVRNRLKKELVKQ